MSTCTQKPQGFKVGFRLSIFWVFEFGFWFRLLGNQLKISKKIILNFQFLDIDFSINFDFFKMNTQAHTKKLKKNCFYFNILNYLFRNFQAIC
jgi:hypothetical protein